MHHTDIIFKQNINYVKWK